MRPQQAHRKKVDAFHPTNGSAVGTRTGVTSGKSAGDQVAESVAVGVIPERRPSTIGAFVYVVREQFAAVF